MAHQDPPPGPTLSTSPWTCKERSIKNIFARRHWSIRMPMCNTIGLTLNDHEWSLSAIQDLHGFPASGSFQMMPKTVPVGTQTSRCRCRTQSSTRSLQAGLRNSCLLCHSKHGKRLPFFSYVTVWMFELLTFEYLNIFAQIPSCLMKLQNLMPD